MIAKLIGVEVDQWRNDNGEVGRTQWARFAPVGGGKEICRMVGGGWRMLQKRETFFGRSWEFVTGGKWFSGRVGEYYLIGDSGAEPLRWVGRRICRAGGAEARTPGRLARKLRRIQAR